MLQKSLLFVLFFLSICPFFGAHAASTLQVASMQPRQNQRVPIPKSRRRDLVNADGTCTLTFKSNVGDYDAELSRTDIFKVVQRTRPVVVEGKTEMGLIFEQLSEPNADPSPEIPNDEKKCYQPKTIYNLQCSEWHPRQRTLDVSLKCVHPPGATIPAERCWMYGFKNTDNKTERFDVNVIGSGEPALEDGCPAHGSAVKLDASLLSPVPAQNTNPTWVAPDAREAHRHTQPYRTQDLGEEFAPGSER